jgi:hypothetical protein
MKQLLKEIGDLIQEKEDSQKDLEQFPGNWCHPSIKPMNETDFNTKLRSLIDDYVKRLAKQAYEKA